MESSRLATIWWVAPAIFVVLLLVGPASQAQIMGMDEGDPPPMEQDQNIIGAPVTDDEICDDSDEVIDQVLTCEVTKVSE